MTYVPNADFDSILKTLSNLYGEDVHCDTEQCYFDSPCQDRPKKSINSDLNIQVFDDKTTLKFTLNDDLIWVDGSNLG